MAEGDARTCSGACQEELVQKVKNVPLFRENTKDRMKLIPLPFEFTIQTDLPPEKAMNLLSAKTKRISLNPLNTSILFVGNVATESFSVKEAVWYSRTYVPVFYGKITTENNITTMRVRASNLGPSALASLFWLAILGLLVGSAVSFIKSDLELAALCGTIAFGFGLANVLSVVFYYAKVEDGRRKLLSVLKGGNERGQ